MAVPLSPSRQEQRIQTGEMMMKGKYIIIITVTSIDLITMTPGLGLKEVCHDNDLSHLHMSCVLSSP